MAEAGLRLMAVHAHCDDETITMGGTLATYADRGVRTCVVCCTDGKLATIVDPNMPEETTRPRLAEIREAELREACRILHVDEVEFLRYGDSGMAGTPTNQLPDAFWMAPIDEATGKIVTLIRRFRPHVVVTYDGNGGYGHPDHIQAHRATLLAVEASRLKAMYKEAGEPWRVQKLYYTAFPRSTFERMVAMAKAAGIDPPFGETNPDEMDFLTPDVEVAATIDTVDVIGRKRDALRAHRSQISDDWPQLSMPDDVLKQFADEYFQLGMSRKPAVLPETDLFAGIEPSAT
ncbi:MAG TPA: N-acetyl-1-D-myo-inositol-2-amino-2-deoxy-alpha-D-glucopyranoside deacetylase [Candidatus Acidoferrales bacterium]|nr:N-acetyl-1-D-myo-inositol-2-amino-2-deoxy-alpha-D-glucopyranoside deacetylase [Candidatus Acidoferrales bacterium]